VAKTSQCPASKTWGVILDATGKVVPGGCHPTKAEADAHMAALYANEPGAGKMTAPTISRDMSVAMTRANALAGDTGAMPNGSARAQLFHGAIMRAKPVKLDGRSGDFYEVEGYASVVDTPYQMYDMFGPYDETIKLGAFDSSLANPELDTAFLVNHKGVTMARTTNGTLSLWADSTGLGSRAYLNANRQDVRDLVSAIDDGLIDEMSFAFYLLGGGWNESYDSFTIYEADINRGDVSAVNYGANPYTSIAARATEIIAELGKLPAGAARAALTALRQRPDIGDVPVVPSVSVEIGRGGQQAEKAAHGKPTGAHTHMHQAYGAQGADEQHTHAHSHNGDDNHQHQHAYDADGAEPLAQWEADLLAEKAADAAPDAERAQPGMSTELLAELLRSDDEWEADAD